MSTGRTPETLVESPSTTEAILDAALAVLGERGLKGATTRLIAQRADVNEVTLFRKFGTKTKLIQAAIEHKFATVQRGFGGYTGDIEADLLRLAETYIAVLDGVGPAARVILAELPHDPDLAGSIPGPQQTFAVVAEVLARYQREGVLREESPQTLIPAFIAPLLMPYVVTAIVDAIGMPRLRIDAHQHVSGFLYGRTGEHGGLS